MLPNGIETKLDKENWIYVGPNSLPWTLSKGPAGWCRVATSLIADDPSSVAGQDGGWLGVYGKWQSSSGDGHVYVRGTGFVVLMENA